MSLAFAAALGAAFVPGMLGHSESETATLVAHPKPAEPGLEARISEADSLDETRAFLALLDSGNAQASYAETAGELRERQGFQLWELGVALRNNRADFSTRKIVGAGGRDDPQPDEWDREVFIFQSKDGERLLTEYIVTQRFDNGWKIIEYNLRGLDENEE